MPEARGKIPLEQDSAAELRLLEGFIAPPPLGKGFLGPPTRTHYTCGNGVQTMHQAVIRAWQHLHGASFSCMQTVSDKVVEVPENCQAMHARVGGPARRP